MKDCNSIGKVVGVIIPVSKKQLINIIQGNCKHTMSAPYRHGKTFKMVKSCVTCGLIVC